MLISTLDQKSALVVIDLQKGLLGYPTVDPMADVVANASKLAKAFRERGFPVVLVNATGQAPGRTEHGFRMGQVPADFADLIDDLNLCPSDVIVSKQTWGAFSDPKLALVLTDKAITEVVIVGVATSIGVESTARQAHELGFNVALAIDAMTDLNADAQTNSLTRIFPRLGETGTTEEILALLGELP